MRKWQWALVISGVSIWTITVSLMVEGSLWGERTTGISILVGLSGLLIVVITSMHALLSKKTATPLEVLKGTGASFGYIIRINEDGSTEVIFGDGIRGAKLPTGGEGTSASYRAGTGEEGKVPNQKTENSKVFADRSQMIDFLGKTIPSNLDKKIPKEPGGYIIYLDVWESEVTGFELPDYLIEPELGGTDTRVKACKYCETLNESDALYCKKCGKKLS